MELEREYILKVAHGTVMNLVSDWAKGDYSSVITEWMEGRVCGAIQVWYALAGRLMSFEEREEIKAEYRSMIKGGNGCGK